MGATVLGRYPQSSGSHGFTDRNSRHAYLVRASSTSTTEDEVLAASPSSSGVALPVLGDALSGDPYRTVTRLTANVQNYLVPTLWTVEVEYSTRPPVNPAEYNQEPLDRVTRPRYFFEGSVEPFVYDANGKPIRNSLGDPIEGAEQDNPRLGIEFQFNVTVFDFQLARLYSRAVNSDGFLGDPVLTWRILDIAADPLTEGNFDYYRVKMRFLHDPRTWIHKELDRGFRYYESGEKKPFSTEGMRDVEPGLLNGRDGGKLTASTTTLTRALDNTEFHATVASANLFPNTQNFFVKIDNEIIEVTDPDGTVNWNIERGKQGTTVADHANGATVTLEPVFLEFNKYEPLPFAPFNLIA